VIRRLNRSRGSTTVRRGGVWWEAMTASIQIIEMEIASDGGPQSRLRALEKI